MKWLPFYSFFFLLITSCGSEDPVVFSSGKSILGFEVLDVTADISQASNTISVELPLGSDISALSPNITISEKASVTPASGETLDFTNDVLYTVTAEDGTIASYVASIKVTVCTTDETTHSFVANGKNYEFIMKNKNWEDAAACAIERGGYLAEINSADENNTVFAAIMNIASLDVNETVSFDGGSASYVWLGGNDVLNESEWIWDGNNDGMGTQFWMGDASGSPVNGLYSNWGTEPDNASGQDGLGLGLTQWPIGSGSLGVKGQWNDIKLNNALFYLIEFD